MCSSIDCTAGSAGFQTGWQTIGGWLLQSIATCMIQVTPSTSCKSIPHAFERLSSCHELPVESQVSVWLNAIWPLELQDFNTEPLGEIINQLHHHSSHHWETYKTTPLARIPPIEQRVSTHVASTTGIANVPTVWVATRFCGTCILIDKFCT